MNVTVEGERKGIMVGTVGRRREREEMKKVRVRMWEWERIEEEVSRVKRREPSITEDMKEANIRPRGREEGLEVVALRKGVQKKTKRYIEPSKMHEARPRVRIRGLVKTTARTDLVWTYGGFEGDEGGDGVDSRVDSGVRSGFCGEAEMPFSVWVSP